MDFTSRSVWEMTKLFVLDPAEASRRVVSAGLPINVSILMLVLAGVLSGVMVAIEHALFGAAPQLVLMPDGSELSIAPPSPLTFGVISVLSGLIFSYMVYWVGARSGGNGRLGAVLSVLAALQIALTVLSVLAAAVILTLPLLGALVYFFILIVMIRGYGHGVAVAHHFAGMGRTTMVLLASLFISAFVFVVLMIFLAPLLMPDFISQLESLTEAQNDL